MPRRPIVKREPAPEAICTAEAWAKLIDRGWHEAAPDPGMRHPRLAYPWPVLDALRLESERDTGNRAAVRLLGRPPAPA